MRSLSWHNYDDYSTFSIVFGSYWLDLILILREREDNIIRGNQSFIDISALRSVSLKRKIWTSCNLRHSSDRYYEGWRDGIIKGLVNQFYLSDSHGQYWHHVESGLVIWWRVSCKEYSTPDSRLNSKYIRKSSPGFQAVIPFFPPDYGI